MNTFFANLSKLYRQARGLLPEALPTGLTAFNAFCDDVFNLYSLPTSKARDVRWMVSTIIVNHKREIRYRSKYWFARRIRAASVKEIAGATMMQCQEDSRQERIKASQAAEATVTAQVADGAGSKTPVLVN